MSKSIRLRAAYMVSTAAVALAFASSALAQNAAAPVQTAQADQSAPLETVVVSASRISIAGYTAPTPVSVVDSGQLQQAANTDIGQTLRQLPMMGTAQSPAKRHPGQRRQLGRHGHQQHQSAQSGRHPHPGPGRWRARSLGRRAIWRGPQHHSQFPDPARGRGDRRRLGCLGFGCGRRRRQSDHRQEFHRPEGLD